MGQWGDRRCVPGCQASAGFGRRMTTPACMAYAWSGLAKTGMDHSAGLQGRGAAPWAVWPGSVIAPLGWAAPEAALPTDRSRLCESRLVADTRPSLSTE